MASGRGRLPLVELNAPTNERSFARSTGGFGFVPNLYRTLGHTPELLEAWLQFAWTLRERCSSPRDLRELCILRVSVLTDAEYEWEPHVRMALHAGLDPERVAAVRSWADSTLFEPIERAVLRATDELIETCSLSGEAWETLAGHVSHAEAVELVVTIAFYACVSRIVRGLEIPLDGSEWQQAPFSGAGTVVASPSDASGSNR